MRIRSSCTNLVACAVLLLASASSVLSHDDGALAAARSRLRAAAQVAGVSYPLERVRVEVHKAARTAILYSGETIVRVYPLGLGFEPVGAKTREGDGKTPEGEYYLCSRNAYSRYRNFIGISYPSPRDAARAYAAGEIGPRTTARISRVRSPYRPPWDTPLGGAIGFHGGGSGADWTLGCIALENDDVDEVWVATRSGTRVIIHR